MTEKLKNFWTGFGSVLHIHPINYYDNYAVDFEDAEFKIHNIHSYLNVISKDAQNIKTDFLKTYARETRKLARR